MQARNWLRVGRAHARAQLTRRLMKLTKARARAAPLPRCSHRRYVLPCQGAGSWSASQNCTQAKTKPSLRSRNGTDVAGESQIFPAVLVNTIEQGSEAKIIRWLDSDTSRSSLGSKVLLSGFSPALPKMIDYAGPTGCPAIPNK
ncbi:uncharacterized protein [Chlorocebus sabaeus]|uniref:uncharacterized protein n=1 Tax=Chlorocebus sabaeus TaxID=60711 RepID=UPI003BFA0783